LNVTDESKDLFLDDMEEVFYRRSLKNYINKLQELNTDAYDMACRTPYIDEMGMFMNGMRTDELALWLIDKREESVKVIKGIISNLEIPPLTANEIKTIAADPFMTGSDARKILKQINS